MSPATRETALVFGASGQDAYYLRAQLADEGIGTVGVSRSAHPDWVTGDVADRAQVEELVKTHRPAFVFHLAANSTTRHEALFENHRTISGGTLNVLEAVRTIVPEAKVFLTGSGLQFVNRGEPIAATDPFEAGSAYAVSRIDSVHAARYYRTLGVRAYVGYLFHHESPRRKAGHMSQKIALAARRMAAGSAETLEIGDAAVRKEWTFAGDVAAGIWTLVGQEAIFEACIGSGETHSIAEWIEVCFGLAGVDERERVRVSENFRAEYPILVSDPGAMHSLGWQPAVSFRDLAEMMMKAEGSER